MMGGRRWIGLVVLGLALGCGADAPGPAGRSGAGEAPAAGPGGDTTEAPAAQPDTAVRSVELSSFLRQPVPLRGAGGEVPLPGSTAGIRAALGEPESVGREPVPNRHVPGQTDTILTLRYPALEAELYRVSGDGRDLLTAVSLTGDRWWLAPGVRVGATRSELVRALGEPDREEDGTLVWPCTDCSELGGESLDVEMAAGRARRLTLRFPVD